MNNHKSGTFETAVQAVVSVLLAALFGGLFLAMLGLIARYWLLAILWRWSIL